MDIVTYALLKKKIESSATGISNIEADSNGDLIFTMADGSTIFVDMPIKMDCLNMKIVNSLPTYNISKDTIYAIKTEMKNKYNNTICVQYVYVDNEWLQLGLAEAQETYKVFDENEFTLDSTTGKISLNKDYLNEEVVYDIDGITIDSLF